MEKIFSAVSYFAVGNCNFNSRFMAIRGTLFLTAKRFLYSFEFAPCLFKVPGIGNLVTVTGSQQTTNSNIQPHRLVALRSSVGGGRIPPPNSREMLNTRVVHQQRDVPTSTRIQLDGNGRRGATLRQWATPTNRQCLNALCQEQKPILPSESSLCEFNTPPVVPFFKVGIFCASTEKVTESLFVGVAILVAMVHC